MKPLELTDANFDTEIIKDNEVSLVDFWAPWCGPCKMLGPIIDELAEQYKDKVKVGKVNIDNNPILSTRYGIKSIPTVLIIKNGEVLEELKGYVPKDTFAKVLDKYII